MKRLPHGERMREETAIPAADPAKGTQPASEGLETLHEIAPGEEEASAAPSPGEWKYCLVCHEQIRSSVRACPYCGTKVVLYEGGDLEPRRFFFGSFLVALGAVFPWGAVPEQWLGDLARPLWLLLGLRQHGDRGGGGVDAPLRLGGRHALHPVHAGLAPQQAVRVRAAHSDDRFLDAAERALAEGHGLPAETVAL